MANQDNPDGEALKSAEAAPHSAPLPPASLSRRRFAGLGASGVILTLASQPAMATEVVCASFSGSISAHASQTAGVTRCEGRSPGFWHKPENWVIAGTDPNAMFKTVFTSAGKGGELIPYTLLEVNAPHLIKPKRGKPVHIDDDNVAMHIVATLLNVRSNKVTFFTEESVMGMWTEYATTGFYIPTAGATPWSGAQLVTHLKERMI